jgi:hypothetical protein
MTGCWETQGNLTIYTVTDVSGESFSKEFAEHNIGKGFHVTGIYPLNFDEDEFR